jgi:rhodanese-related sulfurtransferase/rubrerythrin
MSMLDMFKPVDSVTADEVRKVTETKRANEYCVLDVRQPEEYAQGHIPGARFIPLSELRARLGEVDKSRETYVYCRSGNRSRSATALMADAGMTDVHNMLGGIDAWNGLQASGPPDFGEFCFPNNLKPHELVAVAWLLEDGTQRFYRGVLETCLNTGKLICGVLSALAKAEDSHKATLLNLYEDISGEKADDDFPRSVLNSVVNSTVASPTDEDLMEGCVSVDKALVWAEGREVREVLELMMALEANALDLYIKMARGVGDDSAKNAFMVLCDEEQEHLRLLGSELAALS